MLKLYYRAGFVRKVDFEAAVRGHHAAVEATKSPPREAAAEVRKQCMSNELKLLRQSAIRTNSAKPKAKFYIGYILFKQRFLEGYNYKMQLNIHLLSATKWHQSGHK